MTDERRSSPRLAASIAGEIVTDDGNAAIAITRDVGEKGLLIYTRLKTCSGTVKLRVVHNDQELVLTGRVVRMEPIDDSQLWRNKVAIAVDDTDGSIAKLFSAVHSNEPG